MGKYRRAKGEGSIQQLAKNKYKVQVTLGYDAVGKQIRKSVTVTSKKEAVEMIHILKTGQTLSAPADGVTFFEFCLRWINIKKLSVKAKSYFTYDLALKKHILPALGRQKLTALNTAAINDYLAEKAIILSSATLSLHRGIIYNILKMAQDEGVVSSNAAEKVSPIIKRRKEQNILTDEEIKKLLAAAADYQSLTQKSLNCLYHIILLALATGMRRGELLALKWENIDFEKNTVAVKENLVEIGGRAIIDTPKTINSNRVIAVHPDVLNIIKADLKTDKSPLVFSSTRGSYIAFSTLGRLFRKLLIKANITKKVRLHDLRHTHVTHLLANNYDLKMIAGRIGDDVKTAMTIYAHILPGKDMEAALFIGDNLLK